MLLHIFSVISFARYKEYIICLISFTEFSDILPVFTCASVIGNLLGNWLGPNILRALPYFDLYLAPDSKKE